VLYEASFRTVLNLPPTKTQCFFSDMYKDVTSGLEDKLVVKTRSSREVRSAQLHWLESRSQLRCEFMSAVCMGMYTEYHNSFAVRRFNERVKPVRAKQTVECNQLKTNASGCANSTRFFSS
jgi:hypothetical protein